MNTINQIGKIISDETRLRVLFLLSQDKLCVCQLAGILEIAQPKISKALSKFRDLDLVDDERRDKFVYYQLSDHKLLNTIIDYIESNIDDYPILNKDLSRITTKETYLTTCTSVTFD